MGTRIKGNVRGFDGLMDEFGLLADGVVEADDGENDSDGFRGDWRLSGESLKK